MLYTYLQGRGVELCPSLNYALAQFKLKASGGAYGYGYNLYLSRPESQPPLKIARVAHPASIALLADAAQVNTFQPPATPSNPMLEEFYYINSTEDTAHFRHLHRADVGFCDGHVASETFVPGSIDPRLPGQWVGRLPSALLRVP